MTPEPETQRALIQLYVGDYKPLTELKSLAARMVSIAEETNIANGGSSLEIGDII